MKQVARNLTAEDDGFLRGKRFLILDLDTKFTNHFCEILADDGNMMRREALDAFAIEHGLTFVTVAQLVAYRLKTERLVHRSIPNRSHSVRWSVDTRYSRSGLPTGRSNVPGFVARSRQQPGQVARSHHDWLNVLADAGLDRWGQKGDDTQ